MRYLGFIHEKLGKHEERTDFLRNMLEKEILVRGLKHVLNEWIRESRDFGLNEVLAHAFNLILAPTPLQQRLENGQILYQEEVFEEKVEQKKEESHLKDTEVAQSKKNKKKPKKGKKEDEEKLPA